MMNVENGFVFIHANHREKGGFLLADIDREGGYSRDFLPNRNGRQLIGACVDQYKEQGLLSILDCGCGTGRSLWTIRDQIRYIARVSDEETLETVGIDRNDFSALSRDWRVVQAIQAGEIDYRLGDCRTIQIDTSYDVILMYEMLIYNTSDDVATMLAKYAKKLNPGGSLHAGMEVSQYESVSVGRVIHRLAVQAFDVSSVIKEQSGYYRAFLRVERAIRED